MFKLKKGRTDNDCRFIFGFCCLFIRFVFSDSKKQAKNTAHHFRASDHNNFHIDSLPAELSYQPLYLTTNKIPKQPNEMATKTVAAPEDKTSAVTMPAANARAHFPQQRTCSQRSLGAQNIVFASLSCKTEQKKTPVSHHIPENQKCYFFSEIISTVPSSTAIQAESETIRLLTPSGKSACKHRERS